MNSEPAAALAGKEQAVTPIPVFETTFAFTHTHILATAVDLDLFTQIGRGLNTVESLAAATACSPRGLRILLDALTGLKFLEKGNAGYTLAPVAAKFLNKDSEAYMGTFATVLRGNEMVQANWRQLTAIVRTGHCPEGRSDEDRAKFFADLVDPLYTLSAAAAEVAAGVICAKPAPPGLRVLDIGAGSAVWSLAIARHDPKARVTVVDWPAVIEKATRRFVAREDTSDRYDYRPGSFYEVDFGEAQFDVAILGHICHSEGATLTQQLFRRIHRALKPGGRLLIAEMIPDDDRRQATLPLLFAVNMLVMTADGDTFTLHEYREWLHAAGFSDVTTFEAPAPSPLILARRH